MKDKEQIRREIKLKLDKWLQKRDKLDKWLEKELWEIVKNCKEIGK